VRPDRLGEPSDIDGEAARMAGVERVEVVARPRSSYSGMHRLTWFADGQLPASLMGRDDQDAVDRFKAWAKDQYDFVWFSRVETYLAIGPYLHAPAAVDIDDLQHHLHVARLGVVGSDDTSAVLDRLRRPLVRLRVRKDARLWTELYGKVAASVNALVVCSELDRARLAAPNAVVVPNGYEPPERPLGRPTIGMPPTVLFPGFLQYGPNVDAAHYLAERIGPSLWSRVPEAQIRLVGRADARVQRLHNPPRVVVTGFVPDIAVELARADIVAVPVRYGSGTRVKILEAFAHRIPVVSTAVGVEGIDAADGVHLLVGDSPETFATACAALLVESPFRTRLVDEAQRRLLELYRWTDIRERIGELARSIVDDSALAAGRTG